MTYDRIQLELGCSKSSISLWVRDLPKPDRTRTREESSEIARRGWERTLEIREEARQQTKLAAAADIGRLSDRELFLVGVGLYWSEGSKDKAYQRRERVTFINSDPDMVRVYLVWLRLLGVTGEHLRFSITIHETADTAAAEKFWSEPVGAGRGALLKTTLKRHNPKTVRKHTGDSYHGCLTIRVLQSAELYRRIEGWWCGIVGAASEGDHEKRT